MKPYSLWYERSRIAAKRRYSDWKLWLGLASAVSANSTVRATVKLADKAYWQIKATGTIRRESFVHTHFCSITGVLEDGQPHGRKCRALYQNLIGNESFVPVDIWLLREFGYGNSTPTKRQFDSIEYALELEAVVHGITTAQYQVEVWCLVRQKSDDFSDYLAQLPLPEVL